MTSEQQKELLRLSLSMGAPIRVRRFVAKANENSFDLEFARPERALMKRRMEHVVGRWADAVPGYLAAQLYDVETPTAKGLEIVSADGKQKEEAAIKTVDESRTLRQALCQFEQHRWEATVDQCVVYSNQHSSGGWAAANQTLMAVTLAKQKLLKEAIRALKEIDADDPLSAGSRVLTARWQRVLAPPSE
ncbi:MAG: hypothetical protein FD138_1557 [Planctomycetota bacterium]|nr:MAG: hypothetical protein FD138_1557 [Planctomycetota bacterium]